MNSNGVGFLPFAGDDDVDVGGGTTTTAVASSNVHGTRRNVRGNVNGGRVEGDCARKSSDGMGDDVREDD